VLREALRRTILLAAAVPLVLSDPIPIAESTVAAPPAVVVADGTVHLLWIHRPPASPPATGELWHAAATVAGRSTVAPQRIAQEVDTRFAWPVAVRSGSRLFVAWMARREDTLRLQVTLLGLDGRIERTVSVGAPGAEEGGRISLGAADGIIHLAWSQFDSGGRRVWYARFASDGSLRLPARPVVRGDAPALVATDGIRLLWWAPVGGGNHVLQIVSLDDSPPMPEALTGTVLLVDPLPPIPFPAQGGLDVLVPTTERAFRTSGQLYLVRVRGAGVTARLPLSRGRPVADVSAVAAVGGDGFVVWSEPSGRRQNAEIFGATFDSATGQLTGVTRLTYTPAGSFRPAVTASAGGPVAAWLETLDIARFQVVLGTPAGGRPRRFLLGVPELDLDRPGRLLAFAGTVVAGVLPYAALFAATFGLGALAVLLLAGAVLGGFAWWERVRRGEMIRAALFLGTALVLELLGRPLIPGGPGSRFLAACLIIPGSLGLWLAHRGRGSWMPQLTAASVALGLQMITVLFPWGVRQLSQF